MNIRLLTLVLLLVLACAQTGSCFYNPQPGRWINRDPIQENGGIAIFGFAHNNAINYWDKFGLQCCLDTYAPSLSPFSVGGHSVLRCDNGAYVSFWPVGDGRTNQWQDAAYDQSQYPNQPSSICFDCLDETKVADWLANAMQSGMQWCVTGPDCADVTGAAIGAGLPAPQTRPTRCPCPPDRFHRWVVRDLLESGALITIPTGTADRIQQLVDNGCQRYKCALQLISTGQFE